MRSLAVAVGLTLICAAPLRAQDARVLFERGEEAYAEGRYEEAIRAWQAAFELEPRPRLLFNVARAQELLGDLEAALENLERFLELAPETEPFREGAVRRVASLRERIARTAIRLVGAPAGARIVVDGEDRGLAPRPDPILVAPGEHEVVIQDRGRRQRFHVVVTAGQQLEVRASQDGSGRPVMPWVLIGAGAGTFAVAAVLGGVGFARADDAVDGTPDARRARRLARSADVLGGVGLVSVGAGVVLWILRRRGADDDVAVTPSVGPGAYGAQLELRF